MRVLISNINWHTRLGSFVIPKGSPVELAERYPTQMPGVNEYLVTPTPAIKAIVGEFYWHDIVHYGCRVHESDTEIINECPTSN